MGTLVTSRVQDAVATIAMDDGKANVLSPAMLAELDVALDQAVAERAVVLLTGRAGLFSGGFDLGVLRAGGPEARGMVRAGFELAERLLSFPTPVVVACTGHAVAMGVFLVLSGDYRVGASGPYQLTANEVAIGITMPHAALAICRQRLTPAHFDRAVLLAEPFSPHDAVAAGFLDRVVDPAEVQDVARSVALRLATLDPRAHAESKRRARDAALRAVRAGMEADDAATTPP
jgi:enoyl-CoA hydratase